MSGFFFIKFLNEFMSLYLNGKVRPESSLGIPLEPKPDK
jgi:hypothetical protein